MTINYGRRRTVLPPPNVGMARVAQRRVAEEASRAAHRTRVAVSVDGHPCRVWLRNPRGTIRCPCSKDYRDFTVDSPSTVIIRPGDGDQLDAVDPGYPIPQVEDLGNIAPESVDFSTADPETQVADFARWLLGNGRRCGICYGTGWIDGHHLWGGARTVLCVEDTNLSHIVDDSGLVVETSDTPPSFVGPGHVTWSVSISDYLNLLDGVRVRHGLRPATGDYQLHIKIPTEDEWVDLYEFLDVESGVGSTLITPIPLESEIRLTLGKNVVVSHIDLLLRSEPLVFLQLPQLQQAASQELIAPVFTGEFEIDPVVGAVDRGSMFEVVGSGGRPGSVWIVTDVMVKQTAAGQIFGVTGSARYVQPTETAIAVLSDDSNVGIVDQGVSTRGLEATGGGEPTGLGNTSEDSVSVAVTGTPARQGGGSTAKSPIILSAGDGYSEE